MTPAADASAAALAAQVAREFRRRLQGEYVPRIGRCLELLPPDALWSRPSPNCNSIGNLMLHLRGNTTQWILAEFGAVTDARDRPAEFGAQGGPGAAELVAGLRDVTDRACAIVDSLPVAELLRERIVQGRFRETGLSAVLHVIEHFSGHAGQIYDRTKQLTGADLAFYDL
ncbi:MAG: DinB family protein [Planctomycetota bacterium]